MKPLATSIPGTNVEEELPALNGRRALVIGAISYPGAPLDNAVDDAVRVAAALVARGFTVTTVLNPDGATIDAALGAFAPAAKLAELALVFLAGHAVERHGSGYFLPVDVQFPLQSGSLPYMAISLNEFVQATEGAMSRIVVLDACRNWPQDPAEATRTSADLDQLVADERHWPNLLMAYATGATKGAGDGTAGAGSAFSNSLCRHLLDHGLTVDECFRRVSQDVVASRKGQQPWTYSSLARTLSFSDLPRFAAIQRHAVPNPEGLSVGAWSTTDAGRRAVILGVGDGMAWNVDVGGWRQVRHTGKDRLMGAADCRMTLFLAGSDGALYVAGGGSEPVQDMKMLHSNGMIASPRADGFAYYGSDAVSCFEVAATIFKEVVRHALDFAVYTSAHLPDGALWVAGERGMICEIDPRDPTLPVREVAKVTQHVNALAVSSSGDRVYVVGQHGLAVALDRSGTKVAEMLPGRGYTTAAGIRAQLVNVADDEHIHRFIFKPSELEKRVFDSLSDHMGVPNYPACALAPNLPILAIGTEESTVVLLDTRDMQVIQELDVGFGNSAMVAGVHFLSDDELAVVGGRGEVTFYDGSVGGVAALRPLRKPNDISRRQQ